MIKVVKFGGSSLASATQFAKVGRIITSDPNAAMLYQVHRENEIPKIPR